MLYRFILVCPLSWTGFIGVDNNLSRKKESNEIFAVITQYSCMIA